MHLHVASDIVGTYVFWAMPCFPEQQPSMFNVLVKQSAKVLCNGKIACTCRVGEAVTLCWRLERSPGAAAGPGHDSNTVQYDVTALVSSKFADSVLCRVLWYSKLHCGV